MAGYLAFLTAVGLGLFIFGSYSAYAPVPVRARLSRFTERVRTLEELELEEPFAERVLRPAVAYVARLMARWLPRRNPDPDAEPTMGRFPKKLLLAGMPGNLSSADFVGILVLSILGTAAIFVVIALGISGLDASTAFLMAIIGAILGYLLPSLWLENRIRSRQRGIERALPDAIDLLVVSVQAGISFDLAMQRITDKDDNPLLAEFRRVLAEMQVGRPRRDALRDMAMRTEVADVKNFIAAIIQADQLGVSVSRVIAVQADQIRTLRRQRAEEKAAKAALKMLFPMIFLIFPSLFIVILGPTIPRIAGVGIF